MSRPDASPCPGWAAESPEIRAAVAAYEREACVVHVPGARHRITTRVLGTGPLLILCPGIASTYRVYAPLLRNLCQQWTTCVFDYPGDDPADRSGDLRAIGHDDLAADVATIAGQLGAGQARLFGLSFGSTVALRALARDPERYAAAVIQGGFAHRPFSSLERAALGVGRHVPGRVEHLPFRRLALGWAARAHFAGNTPDLWRFYVEQNGRTPIGPLAHRMSLLSRLDLRPRLPAIPAPVLLVHGTSDRIVPPACYHELHAALPRVRGCLVPGLGHQPFLTHPEQLAAMIDGFLRAPGEP